MIDIDNRAGFAYDEARLAKIWKRFGEKDFELLFVESGEMREINREYRGMDKTTDVLSFPLSESDTIGYIGSVIIDIETAKKVSDELGHAINDEIDLLLVHGILHLLGYDHEEDSGEMYEKEREILTELGIGSGLIQRGEAG